MIDFKIHQWYYIYLLFSHRHLVVYASMWVLLVIHIMCKVYRIYWNTQLPWDQKNIQKYGKLYNNNITAFSKNNSFNFYCRKMNTMHSFIRDGVLGMLVLSMKILCSVLKYLKNIWKKL